MTCITAAELAERWGISLRQVQRLLAEGRIPLAKKYGRTWMIPNDTKKPGDLRLEKIKPQNPIILDFARIISATTIPMPRDNPDSILDTIKDERLRIPYEAELAYLRGDFQHTIDCFLKAEGDDAIRFRICSSAIAATISTGNYLVYTEIEDYLRGYIENCEDIELAISAEYGLATVAVSVSAPNMVPDWLKEGDFMYFMEESKPNAMYLRAKYYYCQRNYEAALAIAETALVLCASYKTITISDIYLRIMCAAAGYSLGKVKKAKRNLLDAMQVTMPHGFVTPFSEMATAFGGLMEECLEQSFPNSYNTVITQWKQTFKNWIIFHNYFTSENITFILTLREYHIAQLVAQHIPYAKIAQQYCISVGRLKNIVMGIYSKLGVANRDGLAKHVLMYRDFEIS